MRHRISAGVIVGHEGRLLLVHHVRPGRYDFWVAPGGGVEGDETLEAAARREAREEAGVDVAVGRLAYIEELLQPGCRHCKFWFDGRLLGDPAAAQPQVQAGGEHITAAAWFGAEALAGMSVFPEVLATRYRQDKAGGFAVPVRLDPRRMAFW